MRTAGSLRLLFLDVRHRDALVDFEILVSQLQLEPGWELELGSTLYIALLDC